MFVMHEQVFIRCIVVMSSSVCSGYVCHRHWSHGNSETVNVASRKGLLYISYGDLV